MGIKTIDRRSFMRGTAAAAAALPLGGLLGSTSLVSSAFAQDAANPFGVADGSTVARADDGVEFEFPFGLR